MPGRCPPDAGRALHRVSGWRIVATGKCGCGWTLHRDDVTDETSLDLDQVRDLLNALGFDADNLLSVQVLPDAMVVRRRRTNAEGKNPTVVETVVKSR